MQPLLPYYCVALDRFVRVFLGVKSICFEDIFATPLRRLRGLIQIATDSSDRTLASELNAIVKLINLTMMVMV